MARPQKIGLDYFPLDVNPDDKISIIEAQHGLEGFAIVIKLFMKIYSEGYFYDWTEKEQILFCNRVNVDINDTNNKVNVVINDCLKWELFDKSMYEKYQILTSRGVQARYMEAVKRRQKVEMIKEYLLLDEKTVKAYNNIVLTSINVDINTTNEYINKDNNPQSKVNESKVNESKEDDESNREVIKIESDHVSDCIGNNNIINNKRSHEEDPCKFYAQNIGPLTPMIGELITQYLNELPPNLLVEGMRIAVVQGVRNMKYVERIWQNWIDKKIKTMDDYIRHEAEWESRKAENKSNKTPMKQLDFNQYPQHEYSEDELNGLFEVITDKGVM